MNILFVCHRLPFPPNRGGKIRPFHMIRHLSQKHSVVVVSLSESEQELREGSGLREFCERVIVEVLPRSVRWKQAWRALLTSTPSSVAYFWSSRLYARVQETWLKTSFDVVIVHCAFVAQYITGLQGGFRILDFGDIDSAKWFDYSKWRPAPLSIGYAHEAKKLRRYEKEMANHFHHCTVTTQSELDEFRTLNASTPCTVIPNGVDTSYFGQRLADPSGSPVIIFLGRMDYYPNVDGIVYFVSEIFPIIRQSAPKAELRIIGSNPVRKVRNLARIPGISVTGHVPDVRPYLSDATVSVVPLRIARGTQNKVLESMAIGIPVVATPEAAKGVQAVPGQHLMVADGPEAFAGQVIKLLQNAKLRNDLSEAGLRQVETAHAWSLSMDILDSILEHAPMASSGPTA